MTDHDDENLDIRKLRVLVKEMEATIADKQDDAKQKMDDYLNHLKEVDD